MFFMVSLLTIGLAGWAHIRARATELPFLSEERGLDRYGIGLRYAATRNKVVHVTAKRICDHRDGGRRDCLE